MHLKRPAKDRLVDSADPATGRDIRIDGRQAAGERCKGLPNTARMTLDDAAPDRIEAEGLLDTDRDDLAVLCQRCHVGYLCAETALTVYCLESLLMKA